MKKKILLAISMVIVLMLSAFVLLACDGTSEGPDEAMVQRANAILQDVRSLDIAIDEDNITTELTSIEIIIEAQVEGAAQSIWNAPIGEVQMDVFAREEDAIAAAEASSNAVREGNVVIKSANDFSSWFFSTLVRHGAPESVFDEKGEHIAQELYDQREGIRNELNRHINRDTEGTDFTYSTPGDVVFDAPLDATRVVMQIGAT